jgi:hypothetical protein
MPTHKEIGRAPDTIRRTLTPGTKQLQALLRPEFTHRRVLLYHKVLMILALLHVYACAILHLSLRALVRHLLIRYVCRLDQASRTSLCFMSCRSLKSPSSGHRYLDTRIVPPCR